MTSGRVHRAWAAGSCPCVLETSVQRAQAQTPTPSGDPEVTPLTTVLQAVPLLLSVSNTNKPQQALSWTHSTPSQQELVGGQHLLRKGSQSAKRRGGTSHLVPTFGVTGNSRHQGPGQASRKAPGWETRPSSSANRVASGIQAGRDLGAWPTPWLTIFVPSLWTT